MYLRELVLNGFKSFAEKTRLELQPGMTAVVGPNGCGKSNIADAIRWVLGEQSAKALRGGKMQDVIFEGSERRKQLSLCEVSLTFAECEKELGTAFNEVQITRRVSRDGASEYFLNGRSARLKDIQRLFMDTGVGRVSYSFLVQGQIDQILSTNPAERRVIFEEAAGITRYKAQRREALNKLALVDANLARVTDVIEEVGRQINSLKRQASKALRYRRLHHRLSNLELASIAWHHNQLSTEEKTLDARFQDSRGQRDNLRARLSGLEAELAKIREAREEAARSLQEAQEKVYQLRAEKESTENKIEYARSRQRDLAERMERLSREVETLSTEKEQLENETANTADSQKAQQSLVSDSDRAHQEKQRQVIQHDEALQKAEKAHANSRHQLLNLENGLTRLRSKCTHLEVELKSFEVRHSGLSENLHRHSGERKDVAEELEKLTESRDRHTSLFKEKESALLTARETAEATKLAFRENQQHLQEADRRLAQLTARLGLLESQREKLEGVGEGPRAILQGKLGETAPKGAFRRISEVIEVEEADTPAIEALLGPLGDLLLPLQECDWDALLNELREKNLSHTWFQVGKASQAEEPLPPTGLRAVNSVIKVKEPECQKALNWIFKDCYLANDLGVLLNLLQAENSFYVLAAACPTGECLEGRGLIRGGRNKSSSDSPLRRENAIRSLKKDIEALNGELYSLREKVQVTQTKLETDEQKVEDLREERDELRRELSNMENQHTSLQNRLEKEVREEEKVRAQLKELEQANSEASERLESARKELVEAEQGITRLKKEIADAEASVVRIRGEREQAREGLAELRLELAEKTQALEMLRRSLGERRNRIESIEETLRQNAEERSGCQLQRDTLEEEIGNSAARVKQLETTMTTTRENLDTIKKRLDAEESKLRQEEEAAGTQRERLSEVEGAAHKVEMELTQCRTRKEFLLDRLRSNYQQSIEEIDWKDALWRASQPMAERIRIEDLEGFDDESLDAAVKQTSAEPGEEDLRAMEETDWKEVESEVNTLREKIQALGAVNLVAIEEYADLRQRYDFLKQQSDDLWTSKEELVKAIDEINSTSRELFSNTFEQVRKNFAYTYDQLTGGGKADLTLMDDGDVLESGIDIVARPPGTRLTGISRLSGGQRTMTAVALLFAIYMVKPSPFCVLDELDAPLDDANIGRFVDMLKQFLQQSQFVIITHNKRTIAAADSVFGVTMQEKGVSHLLSMRFARDQEPEGS